MAEPSAASLAARINDDLKTAMRAGDAPRRDALRLLRAAILNAELKRQQDAITYETTTDETGSAVQTPVSGFAAPFTDADVQAVIRTQIKQRRDSIAQFEKANRAELAAKEQSEIDAFAVYLPAAMDEAAMRAAARAVIAEVHAAGPKDMGKVMPVLLARVGDTADRGILSGIVRQLLSA